MKLPVVSMSPTMMVILPLALLLSLGLNLWQAKRFWIQEATAPLEEKIEQLEATQAANNTISDLKVKDDAKLTAARTGVERRANARQTRLSQAKSSGVVAPCAPGQDVVDTWNAIGQGASE